MTPKQFKQRVPKLPKGPVKVMISYHYVEANVKTMDGWFIFRVSHN